MLVPLLLVLLLPFVSAFVPPVSTDSPPSSSSLFGTTVAFTHKPSSTIPSSQLELGEFLGNGTFGTVRRGILTPPDDTTTTSPIQIIAKMAKRDNERAMSYLDTEAYINKRLCLETNGNSIACPYIAPLPGRVHAAER